MNRKLLGIVIVVVIAMGGVLVWRALNPPTVTTAESNLIGDDFEIPQLGFEQVTGEREWVFPADAGAHPEDN